MKPATACLTLSIFFSKAKFGGVNADDDEALIPVFVR
ncbi:hypothetical protein ATCR1_23653, partial [Agrobacterium tumefaciens CCNWGS0286]